MNTFTIRLAQPGDEDTIYELLREFAEFEFRLDEYKMTPDIVRSDVFGPTPKLYVALAYAGGEPAGLANWYWTYSSFAAKRGMFVEDIFVLPKFRKQGLGKQFLAYLAKAADAEGAQRMDWMVLDWNEKAMLFYKNLGCRMVAEWITFRLEGDAMKKLVAKA